MKKIIELYIKPGSKKFEIIGFNEWTNCLEIKTKKQAVKGKANKELQKKLQKIFKTKIKIQGLKSRNKKLLIENKTKKEILELIEKNKKL